MAIKKSDLTPEQMKVLREMALKKVNRKLKSAEDKNSKERKWAANQEEPRVVTKAPDADKVPVKIDSRTTIMVLRDKCVRNEDGTWRKK